MSCPPFIKLHMFFFWLWVEPRKSRRQRGERERETQATGGSISGSSYSHCSLLPICFYFQEPRGTIVLANTVRCACHQSKQRVEGFGPKWKQDLRPWVQTPLFLSTLQFLPPEKSEKAVFTVLLAFRQARPATSALEQSTGLICEW